MTSISYDELEYLCRKVGLRLEASHYDCGERLSVWKGKARIMSVSRDCDADERAVDVMNAWLEKRHYLDASTNSGE
jgi:hypothetical protein